jgi:LPXTG-motif cell wall-anchored protein
MTRTRAVAIAAAALALASLALPSRAPAGGYPPTEGALEVSRTVVRPGTTVVVVARDFCPGSSVQIWLIGGGVDRLIAAVRADADGRASASVKIPQLKPGTYWLVARGLDRDCQRRKESRARITVLGPVEPTRSGAAGHARHHERILGVLPRTGRTLASVALFGTLLIAVGVLIRTRRRRSSDH